MAQTKSNAFECCREMLIAVCERRVGIGWLGLFNEFSLAPRDDRAGECLRLLYCPWCGVKLPESMRQAYFEETQRLGFHVDVSKLLLDPPTGLPPEYTTDEWWRNRNP